MDTTAGTDSTLAGTREEGRITSDTDNDMAVMSKAAYGDADAKERLAKEGYQVDPALTDGDRYITFTKDGKAYLAFRGTDMTDVRDIMTDYAIAIGDEQTTAEFKKGAKAARQAVKKYGKDNTTFTGHSLGGTIALYANSETGAPAITFATGVGLGMVAGAAKDAAAATVFRRRIKPNTKIYAVHRDAVSMLAPFTNSETVFVPRKADGAHALDNFVDWTRYNKAQDSVELGSAKRKKKQPEDEGPKPFLSRL